LNGTDRSIQRDLAQAVALSGAGQFAPAEALCRQVLAVQPAEPTALHVLGVCLLQQGRYAEAEQALAACLQAQPDEPAALGNRGIALQALGRFDEALACYAQSLRRAPGQPATLNMQGLALMELKRFDEALQSFEQAVAVAPNFAEAWCSRANALIQLHRYEQALDSLDRAEALRPNYGEALSNRSIVLNLLGRHEQALAAAQRALPLLPQQATVHRNLADALLGLARFPDALHHYNLAIRLAPDDYRLLGCRADLLALLGRAADAASDRERALDAIEERVRQLRQVASSGVDVRAQLAEGLYERGLLLVDASRYREAIGSLEEATALRPGFAEAHLAEALNRLRLGDYEHGWRKYEWRRRRDDRIATVRHFDRPEWLGDEDPAGRHILLHAEQGFGDVLQFCRYAPLLAKRGATVTLLVQPPLRSLLRSLAGVEVIAEGDDLPAFDRHCPLLSLPLAFRTTVSTVPATVPYLRPDEAAVTRWRTLLGAASRPRVGLAWSGNARNPRNRVRSIALDMLEPLLDIPAEFIGLNKEAADSERAALRELPIRTLGELTADFADSAALIECLDLVITVDTAVAHLAGALAKPVWVLLDARPDFRWMLERDDSPWYPTARLFRQPVPGDWAAPLRQVSRALQAVCSDGADPLARSERPDDAAAAGAGLPKPAVASWSR
jgi:tetratricopeptide (TPR) repeat protein